jgi:hypothetical protein
MLATPDAVVEQPNPRGGRLSIDRPYRYARADQHDDLAAGNLLAQVVEKRLSGHVDLQQHYQSKRRDRTLSEKPSTTANNDFVRAIAEASHIPTRKAEGDPQRQDLWHCYLSRW